METINHFYLLLILMSILAILVFFALYHIDAGYGKFITPRFGPTISNRWGWLLMESPVFILMGAIWLSSNLRFVVMPILFLGLFELHYFQRSFIFPLLMRGKGRMPISIIVMGIIFNCLNAVMQGGWIFYFGIHVSPEIYQISWLRSFPFLFGTFLFLFGMIVNLHSDAIIRNLRKKGDTRHYLPKGGFFRYVSSANYFGEFIEWCGFALLTWSPAGAVFALWTFANLAPRANAIYHQYEKEFGKEFTELHLKRILPFIY